jgi:Putative adhesin
MNPRRFLAASVLGLGALVVSSAAGQAQAQNPQTWKGTVLQGSAIEIKGVNGGITASAAAGGEVEVSAEMRGRRSNPADVKLDIVQHGDGVTICAVYPSPDGRPNECQPGDGGRMNVRDNDVTVAFTVRVPPGVRFIGRTVNGDVKADGLSGAVAVQTVNGDASFSTSAHGEATTVNGSITAAMGNTLWNDALKFRSVNGSVSLDLPTDASTDLDVATVNGSISTDFPLTVTGRISPKRLNGTIGAGGRSMSIETVNGSVTIRKK